MLKQFISRCAIVLNALAIIAAPSAFASPEEMVIEDFLNSGAMRHVPADTSMLNSDGLLGDFIILPNGDYLVIGLDMSDYMGPPGPLDVVYTSGAMSDLQTTIVGTHDVQFIGKGPYAASVINRTVDTQPFCAFDGVPSNGFLTASRIPATSGMAMVNGMPMDLDIELTVVPAAIAASWPTFGLSIALPAKECKLSAGCPPVSCSVSLTLGGLSFSKSGTCQLGTRLYSPTKLECACAIFSF